MSLELSYNLRYLVRRRATSFLTLVGVALVVTVYAATLMLSAGLQKTLSTTGSMNNMLVLRAGAENEIQSGISREHAGIVLSHPAIARNARNEPVATRDVLVLLSLNKRSNGEPSNVNVRGISSDGWKVRSGVRIIEGRTPRPGTREVAVGTAVNRRFSGTGIGDRLRLSGTDWEVVGLFDAGNSAFSSEIWGDADIMLPVFKRDAFSSVLVRLKDGTDGESMKRDLENDRRLSLKVQREQEFYASQSQLLAMFIEYLGTFVSVVFSLAAIIGCMITMYAAVSQRIREIGILRALGFTRGRILRAYIVECLLLALGGGLLGLFISAMLVGRTFSTTNFQTFADLTFEFSITAGIAFHCVAFSLAMGLIGGVLPAWHASRLKVVSALREM